MIYFQATTTAETAPTPEKLIDNHIPTVVTEVPSIENTTAEKVKKKKPRRQRKQPERCPGHKHNTQSGDLSTRSSTET